MRLSPNVWGPFFWHTIHIVALGYPQKPNYAEKKAAKEFFESLAFLLPCSICKEHLRVHLRKHPITPHLDRRDDLFKYTVMLHNEVNISLNKPTMTELEVLYYYKKVGARDSSPVINKEMLDEIDMRSMIKGGFIGGGLIFITGLSIYYFSKE
jgi:hypothetical protein